MGKMSRDKGAKGEREVAKLFQGYGIFAKRGCQHKGGPDSPDVAGVPGTHVEVKRTEKLSLYDALSQSKRDAGPEEIPIVIHRRNGKGWVVILEFDDFMKMYQAWQKEERHGET